MTMPQPGEMAPDFELQDDQGNTVTLSHYRGQTVVLYFYPRADTPGCTKEACAFRDDYSAYQERGVAILGASPDTVANQSKFKKKYGLPFPLLADSDHVLAEQYGVWGLKKFMGRESMGVMRTTFIIDKEGKVIAVFEKVRPAEHSAEILAVLE